MGERSNDRVLFAMALVVLVFHAAGGAWGGASDHAVIASSLERTAGSPLYSLLAGVAAYLPIGEPWLRLGALNAVLGAVLLVGVARASRGLLPKDPIAGVVAAITLALSPPFREAAAFAGSSMLASCGVVWTLAFALEHAREPNRERAFRTLAAALVVIGSAPWLGVAIALFAGGWVSRAGATRETLILATGAIGATVVVLWFGAGGSLPDFDLDLAAVVGATGRGAAAVVIGAGLLGAAFAAVTGLAYARWIAGAIAIVSLHAVVVDHAPVPILAVFALGLAVIPSGIVRAVPNATERRHLIAGIAGLPLIAASLLAGPAFSVDDPGHAPARVAADLTVAMPPGPGMFAATRLPTWSALAYAQQVAGARPDLTLLPPIDKAAPGSDVVIADGLRAGKMVGADVPAFGRLDLRLAYPRGRAFQLITEVPPQQPRAIPPPARYASVIGEQLGVLAAVDRARYEAANGRLGAAARAAGLAERFGAGDLAILSTTAPSRPAFFGFIPKLDGWPPGPWLLELLGDDLAWSAGIDPPVVETPRERKLHALWRAVWRGEIKPDDPQIAALGPEAVQATLDLIEELVIKKNRR
jgi:hypothetical protein